MTTLDLTLSAPDDELPHPIRPDVPLWSENYAFVCYDAAAQVGVFTHIGRLAHNPDFWRGTTAALLPGGRLLISKTVGLPAEPEVPSSGPLAIRCEEPFSRWLLTHDAPAIESDSTSAGHALVAAGAIEPLAYELTFEQIAPVWDLTDWMRGRGAPYAPVHARGAQRPARGHRPTRPRTKVIVEAPCRYTWNGETGYGWLERSRRIDQL